MTVEQEEFFEELYSKYFNKIRLYAESVIPNEERAHEVAQDTFHEAVRKIDEVTIIPTRPRGCILPRATRRGTARENTCATSSAVSN